MLGLALEPAMVIATWIEELDEECGLPSSRLCRNLKITSKKELPVGCDGTHNFVLSIQEAKAGGSLEFHYVVRPFPKQRVQKPN